MSIPNYYFTQHFKPMIAKTTFGNSDTTRMFGPYPSCRCETRKPPLTPNIITNNRQFSYSVSSSSGYSSGSSVLDSASTTLEIPDSPDSYKAVPVSPWSQQKSPSMVNNNNTMSPSRLALPCKFVTSVYRRPPNVVK